MAVIALLLCAGCNRSGLSWTFRGAAEDAFTALREAENTQDMQAINRADVAIAEARAKVKNNRDVQMADVLAWYAILVHRRDRWWTRNWRQVCGREVELYLAGEEQGTTRISGEDVPVTRGSCQTAAFQMMAADCRRAGLDLKACMPPSAAAARLPGGASVPGN